MADWKEVLASLYGKGAEAKNFLFDSGLMDAVQLNVPVLSIGNLSMGGTGKTPVVEHLIQMALDRGATPLVVAKNYMARSRGIHRIETSREGGANYYGDEAFMLAQKFPGVQVWTGPQKYLTAQYALKESTPDLVVIDDGFQHRSLHRDFDLVLLDATEDIRNEVLVPKGRFREDFRSLERAHLIALTKTNWVTEERLMALRRRLPKGKPVVEIEFHLKVQDRPEGLGADNTTQVMAVSGIAKPQVFEQSIKSLSQFQVLSHQVFPDHYAYQNQDAEKILNQMRKLGASEILTTEKDFVKLQAFPALKSWLNPLKLELQFQRIPQEVYDFLDRSRRR